MNLSSVNKMLRESVGELSEAYFTGGLGTFGGRDHRWPELGGDWEGPHAFSANTVDTFGDSQRVEYLNGPITISLDANKWYGAEGKGPVTYVIDAGGQKKMGQIKAPTKQNIERVAAASERFFEQARKQLVRNLLKARGWKRTSDDHDVYYDMPVGGKHNDAHMSVTFRSVGDVLGNDDEGRAEVYFSAGADYEGSYGKKEKTVSWRTLADMTRIIQDAERFGKQAYKSYRGK